MSEKTLVTRRVFLMGLTGAAGVLAAGCAAQQLATVTPAPTGAPAATATKAATAVPAATAAPTAAPAAIKRGGVLRAQRVNDWATLDPHLSASAMPDAPLIHDYLTRFDLNPATGLFEVRPSLAESWQVQDPTTVVFKLRSGVKFHDGTDFTAQVAKWNLERMMTNAKSAAKTQTASIASVEAVDATTLKLKLKAPSASLLANLTSDADSAPAMISQAAVEKLGDAGFAQQPVGCGPFKFGEWKAASHVFYKKWDQYWKKGADGKALPYLDEAQVYVQPDWSVAVVQLRSGDSDLMTDISAKDVAALKGNPNVVYQEYPWQATVFGLCFNVRPGGRFAGDKMKLVRQAIFAAIDRNALAEVVGQGIGEAAFSPVVAGQIGYSDKLPGNAYDPAKAKQLLAAAGFPSGIDITLDFISRDDDRVASQVYQQMLAAVGVRITLQPSERVAWAAKTMAGNYELAGFYVRTRPDPDLVLAYNYAKTGAGNYAGWSNAEVEKLLEEGRSTYEDAKRQAIYEQVQSIAAEEAYYGWFMRRKASVAYTKALKGFEPPWSGYLANSTALWLDR